MRGKIVDGEFIIAPNQIKYEINNESFITYNPTDEILANNNWLQVIEQDAPDETPLGYYYKPNFIEQEVENEKIILQVWELVESSNEISSEEALSIITGGYV